MLKSLAQFALVLLLPLTAFAQYQTSTLCEGDEVVTNDHRSGVIQQVFPDGLVKVRLANSYSIYDYNVNQLSRPVQCLQGLCVKQDIVTNDHRLGTIQQIFPDGLVKVRLANSYSIYDYNISQLARDRKCNFGLCVGQPIVTKDHRNGTVQQIFPDGLIKIRLANSYSVYDYNVSQISRPVDCLSGICVNDAVVTTDHRNGTVQQIFPDGLVKVRLTNSYSVYDYNLSQLARYKPCLRTGAGSRCQ